MSEKPQQNIASDDEIDLLQLFSVVYARKFFIIFIALVAGFIGAVKALNTPPMYQADALLLIEEKSGGGLALSADISELIGGSKTATIDEVAILRSRMILGAVVDNLDLTRWAAPKRLPFAGQILARYDIPDPGWTFLSSYAWHDEEIKLGHLFIPENLREEILILTYQSEGLFVVTSDSGLEISGTVGQRMVDDATGIELLVDYLVAIPGRQFFIGQNARTDLISLLQGALSVSEPDWESSILALNLVYSDQEMSAKILNEILEVYLRQNLSRSVAEVEGSLDFVRSQLPEAQELVTAAEDALNVYKLSQESVDLTFETRALLEQAVQIETQLNALQLEEQELRKRFTESHPIYQTLLDNRQQLIDRLEGIRSQTSALPETQQIMLRLSQDLEVSQQIYLQLVNRAQELNVIKAGTIGNIRVIDAAVALPSPISPNRKMIFLLAVMLGGGAAIGYVLLRSFLRQGINSPEAVEQIGIPVYASVNKVGNGQYGGAKRSGNLKTLALEDPASLAVEALRSLRTSLHFGMLDAQSSLLAVTSSRPGDGKSFISINLATVMAQAGQNVCLVDADLRRGHLRRYFGIAKSAPGLTDVLAGDALIEDVVQQDKTTGLFFLPAGQYPPNPSELLMSKAFSDVLTYLDQRFEQTIIDCPPVLAVTDPVIICKYAGMVLLVARYYVTDRGEIKAAQKVFDNNDLKFTGAVLNGYDSKKSAYGYTATHYQYGYKTRDT